MQSVQEAPEEKLEVLRRRAPARPVEGCCCPSFDYATTSNGAADEIENKNASPAILGGVTVATTPTTERPIPRDRRGNFDRSEPGDRTGSKGARKPPMVLLFFVTKTRNIGTTIRRAGPRTHLLQSGARLDVPDPSRPRCQNDIVGCGCFPGPRHYRPYPITHWNPVACRTAETAICSRTSADRSRWRAANDKNTDRTLC
jgi:hypothetical protein